MKISTNFIRPAQQAVMPVVVMLWLITAGLAGGAWWLLEDAAALRGELPQLRQRYERAEKMDTFTTKERMPSVQALAETRNRIAKINAAGKTKGGQSAALLNELETSLPADAWLTSLHYRATEGEVRMVVAAKNSQPLTVFLQKLERDTLFEEVMLMREIQSAGNAQAGVQYEIRLKVRS